MAGEEGEEEMKAIQWLAEYAIAKGLIGQADTVWARNRILDVLKLDEPSEIEAPQGAGDPGRAADTGLAEVLELLLEDALRRGVLPGDSVVYKDLLDTEIMGQLTPMPSQVIRIFREKYASSAKEATDWFYHFSQSTNYIRMDRIRKDIRWKTDTPYGELDITINLSKPEKDPKMIAAAGRAVSVSYPACQLCMENEGYAGRTDHPARQNHRLIPLTLDGESWAFQYSPYVYYPEHCIVLSQEHRPMKIDRGSFVRLLDFVGQFPHYFVGSNADLPIVGGSILSHDHFQGGHYVFPMEKAPVDKDFQIAGYEDVQAGVVKWPMSVLRISCEDPARLAEAADKVLRAWRQYTDEEAVIYAFTDKTAHNTITPIARMRDGRSELDLVLRNNLTTKERPLGLYHPRPALHHIKKENIGLIEVMGLAVLPGRLKEELTRTAEHLAEGEDLRSDPLSEKHADWAEQLAAKYSFTKENALEIIRRETGLVFEQVLEDAGVYKRTGEGSRAFDRFLSTLSEE